MHPGLIWSVVRTNEGRRDVAHDALYSRRSMFVERGYLSAQETSPHFKGRQLPRWADQVPGLNNRRHLARAVGPKFSGTAI